MMRRPYFHEAVYLLILLSLEFFHLVMGDPNEMLGCSIPVLHSLLLLHGFVNTTYMVMGDPNEMLGCSIPVLPSLLLLHGLVNTTYLETVGKCMLSLKLQFQQFLILVAVEF